MTFSNTTPLFAFSALGRFDLLEQVHPRLWVVESVVKECEVGGPIEVPNLRTLPWIEILPAPSHADERFYMLDAGERDTISAALPPELRGAGKLRVVAWFEPEEDRSSSVGAGQWALEARGIARLLPGETQDDARQSYLRRKFGTT